MKRRTLLQVISCLPIFLLPSLAVAAPKEAALQHVTPIRLADMFALVERWDLHVDVVLMSPQALRQISELLKTELRTPRGCEPSFEYWNAVISSDPQCKDDEVKIQASLMYPGTAVERYERFEFSWSRNDAGTRKLAGHVKTPRTNTNLLPGQVLGLNDLSLSIEHESGAPADVAEVNYSLYDVTTGLEALIGYPRRTPVRHQTGRYYAALRVPLDANHGLYRIRWSFRKAAGKPIHWVVQDFNVGPLNRA